MSASERVLAFKMNNSIKFFSGIEVTLTKFKTATLVFGLHTYCIYAHCVVLGIVVKL
jgi:hypothetical protein